jgi:hypothetical protein
MAEPPPRAQGRQRPLLRPRRLHVARGVARSGGRGGDPTPLPRARPRRARAPWRHRREVHRRCGDGTLRRAYGARGRRRAGGPGSARDPRLRIGGRPRTAGEDRDDSFIAACASSPHYAEGIAREARASLRLARGDIAGAAEDRDFLLEHAYRVRDQQRLIPSLAATALSHVLLGGSTTTHERWPRRRSSTYGRTST